MAKYDHKKIESKWQGIWESTKLNNTDLTAKAEKFYNLVMFPYPSGEYLHIGHGYSYSGADVYGRYMRATGKNVFEPIGFDSFGLPAENYAIKKGVHPAVSTADNIVHATAQLKSFGCMFDFEKMVTTSSPEYYRWTQWIFLKLYERGLAYQKESPVNWCPKCVTVLANEQVIDGICERCETEVIQKNMKQWFFKITDYADRLDQDLNKVDWPSSSKLKQRNWIGKSTGVEFDLGVVDMADKISVFTTRIDTVFGMSYVVLAPEHALAKQLGEKSKEIAAYLQDTKSKSDLERQEAKEKTGVPAGIYAINPFNGEKVPVWIADYVIGSYGTGAVMAVPAHDERDYEFAKKFGLPIKEAIAPYFLDPVNKPKPEVETEKREVACMIVRNPKTDKYLCLKWKKAEWQSFPTGGLDGQTPEEAGRRELLEETGYKNLQFVEQLPWSCYAEFYRPHKKSNVIAHFHYVLFDLVDEEMDGVEQNEKDTHDVVWLEKEEIAKYLNVWNQSYTWERLQDRDKLYTDKGILVDSGEFTGLTSEEAKEQMAKWLEEKGIGSSRVNYRLRDWSFSRQRYWGAPIPVVYCSKCGTVPVPEQGLPVLLPELSIDQVRPTGTGKGPLAGISEFVHVQCPKCGGNAERETDTMDTFVCSSFYFLRYPNVGDNTEMFNPEITKKWLPVDMYVGGPEHVTMHLLYSRFVTKALYDSGIIGFDEPFMKLRHQGMILGPDGKKMSKSKGNVIVPNDIISEVGADAFRTYILFMGRFEDGGPWNPQGLTGVTKLLERVWKLSESKLSDGPENIVVGRLLNKSVKKIGEDIEAFRFNTAVPQLMILVNELVQQKQITKITLEKLVVIMAPFAPYITEEIWSNIGNTSSIHVQPWPEYDPSLIVDETLAIAVQVNGKVRDTLLISAEASEAEVIELAKESTKVANYILDKNVKKMIYIKGKILSIVTE